MPRGVKKVDAVDPVVDLNEVVALDDPDFATPFSDRLATASPIYGIPLEDIAPIPTLVDIVREAVAAEMAKVVPATQGAILDTKLQSVAPPSYKKHYRNDKSLEYKVQEMDMSTLDRGERPQSRPLPGQWIKFRRGHLYTNSDNVIRQLEYMMNRDQYADGGDVTVGGNPAIYEDDGTVVFRCPQGCDFITASKAGFRAHMKSTHGVSFT